MTLGEKQELFMKLLPRLIDKAHELGFTVRGGDLFRDPRCPYGISRSCHQLKLAIDLNLFENGVYLTRTEDHKVLGEWWEKLHWLCRWGGRFQDGNHYSLEHDGRK